MTAAPPHPHTNGRQQERLLRHYLDASGAFDVRHSPHHDRVYKLDLVASVRADRTLPPVGVQFTTRPDAIKLRQAIASVQRSQVVARFLYLEAACDLDSATVPVLIALVAFVAHQPQETPILSAVLARGGCGSFLRDVRAYPAENNFAPAPDNFPVPCLSLTGGIPCSLSL